MCVIVKCLGCEKNLIREKGKPVTVPDQMLPIGYVHGAPEKTSSPLLYPCHLAAFQHAGRRVITIEGRVIDAETVKITAEKTRQRRASSPHRLQSRAAQFANQLRGPAHYVVHV